MGEYLFLKCHIELKNINLKLYDTSNLSLEGEKYLMLRLLERAQQKIFLIKKKQKPVNSTKEIINKEDNNSLKIQEENENESCFTEENVLKDNNNDSCDFKEKVEKEEKEEKEEKNEPIYLGRKRNMKHDDNKDEDDNNKMINISNEEIEEILKEIREEKDKNPNYLNFDINRLNNLEELKITYDDYIESEDDEACI